MRKIEFSKAVASGNDFVIFGRSNLSAIRYPLSAIAKQICNRKYGVGADGLLVLDKTKAADLKMRIFNADGSEAPMCGNGARCAAIWWANSILKIQNAKLKIKTKAGIIESEVKSDNIRIKLTDPKNIKLDIPLTISGRKIKVSFTNTGVPHAVVFVEGLSNIDVFGLGKLIRFHKYFAPAGANVNFVEICGNNLIKVRTYERGVENETLACGTGSVASVVLSAIRYPGLACPRLPSASLGFAERRPPRGERREASRQALSAIPINVRTQSGEVLKVYFRKVNNNFTDIRLEGKAKIVYTGEFPLI